MGSDRSDRIGLGVAHITGRQHLRLVVDQCRLKTT